MKNYNYRILKSIREKEKLTQAQMAERLGMTQSNYSKLENNLKKIDAIEMFNRLAKVLNFTKEELEALLTGKQINGSLEEQLTNHKNFIEALIGSVLGSYEDKYIEGVAWEDFNEDDHHYIVEILGIKTKKEYEAVGYPLSMRVRKKNHYVAFREMVEEDVNVQSCFELGIVKCNHYLNLWNKYKREKENSMQ